MKQHKIKKPNTSSTAISLIINNFIQSSTLYVKTLTSQIKCEKAIRSLNSKGNSLIGTDVMGSVVSQSNVQYACHLLYTLSTNRQWMSHTLCVTFMSICVYVSMCKVNAVTAVRGSGVNSQGPSLSLLVCNGERVRWVTHNNLMTMGTSQDLITALSRHISVSWSGDNKMKRCA